MSFLTRNAVILAKKETTYGTDATPAGANAILVRNLSVTPQQAEFADRDVIRPFYGASESLPTGISAQIEFEVELQASGTLGVAPGWGPLLRACAFAETITAGASVAYSPVSSGFESLSLVYSLGSETSTRLLHKLLGARGTVQFVINSKAIPVMKYRFQGLYSAVVDDTTTLTPDFSAFQTPLTSNAKNTPTFALHGVSSPMAEFSLDVANTLAYRALIGEESIKLTDRKSTGSITFDATSVATKNWWDIARYATLGTLDLVHGLTAGKIIELSSSRVQLKDPQYKDDNGIAQLTMGTVFVPSSAGNDELLITCR